VDLLLVVEHLCSLFAGRLGFGLLPFTRHGVTAPLM
jgi:hypothetical protein